MDENQKDQEDEYITTLDIAAVGEPKNETEAEILKLLMEGSQSTKSQDWEKAETCFRKAYEMEPEDPEIIFALAQANYLLKRHDEAIRLFNLRLEKKPDDVQSMQGLVNSYLSKGGSITIEDIQPWLEKIVDSGANADWAGLLVEIYMARKQYDDAIRVIKFVFEKDGSDPNLEKNFSNDKWRKTHTKLLDHMVASCLALKDYQSAVTAIEVLTTIDQSPAILAHMGVNALKAGMPEKALEAFRKYFAAEPDNVNVASYIASTYREHPEADLGVLDKLLMGRSSAAPFLARAMINFDRGDDEAGLADALTALAMPCKTSEATKIVAGLGNFEVARYYMHQKDNQSTEKYLKRALRGTLSDADRKHMLHHLSITQYHLAKYRPAKSSIEKALRIDPKSEYLLDDHLEFCRKTGATGDLLKSAFVLAHIRRDEAQKVVLSANDPMSFTEKPSGPAPLLLESSIDLKLTPEGNVKIIELNDLYASGFDGFKRAYDTRMREDIVYPYHNLLQSLLGNDVEIVRPHASKQRLSYLCLAEQDNGNIYSSTLPWWAMNEYKDYMHLNVPQEWDHMFPRTLVIARDPGLGEEGIRRLAEQILDERKGNGPANFVFKPCDDSIGHGVELVREEDLVREIHKITSWQAPKGEYWNDHIYPNFLVQECIRSRPIEADNGKLYDGTMRVAFTAVISPDRQSVQSIQFHGAYWKLPSRPYDHEDSRNSVVSFPPSELSKIANKAFAAEIPVSARVNDDDCQTVYGQLRPWLTSVLPFYSGDAEAMRKQIQGFLRSDSHAHRGLGVEIASNFQAATAIEVLCGEAKREKMSWLMQDILSITPGDTAAGRYFNYLTQEPIRTAAHAAIIGDRALSILQPRYQEYAAKIVLRDVTASLKFRIR